MKFESGSNYVQESQMQARGRGGSFLETIFDMSMIWDWILNTDSK